MKSFQVLQIDFKVQYLIYSVSKNCQNQKRKLEVTKGKGRKLKDLKREGKGKGKVNREMGKCFKFHFSWEFIGLRDDFRGKIGINLMNFEIL